MDTQTIYMILPVKVTVSRLLLLITVTKLPARSLPVLMSNNHYVPLGLDHLARNGMVDFLYAR